MMMVMIIVLIAIAMVAGLASAFARSPTHNPLAEISIRGINGVAAVISVQPHAQGFDVELEYRVGAEAYRRVVPWPQSNPPTIGSPVSIIYLPDNPGACRVDV